MNLDAVRDDIGMQLEWCVHLVLFRQWRHVPLPDLEVFAGGQPSLVHGQVPDFDLHDGPRFHLGEELDSTTNAYVQVENVVSAQDRVNCICSLWSKRVIALREILVSDG